MKKFYVARDSDGELNLYEEKPKRGLNKWITARNDILESYIDCARLSTLSESDFPELTWENEPLEVMLVPCSSTVPILNMEKSKEELKIWIARDEPQLDEDDKEDKLGELHLFYDSPILQFDQERKIMRWRCAREIATIPSYMYPEIRNGQCKTTSKILNK